MFSTSGMTTTGSRSAMAISPRSPTSSPLTRLRIIAYRLSPLYISVHATDPVVRRWILRNPQAPDILPQMREFAAHGLEFHTQIVMAPGVNDGAVLRQTLEDLWAFGPEVLSVSVVPVGLTEFSKHSLIREPDVAECRDAVTAVEAAAARARRERGDGWCFGADELYLRAGVATAAGRDYGSFDQVENGVGSVRWLQLQVRDGARSAARVGREAHRRGDGHVDGAADADGPCAAR